MWGIRAWLTAALALGALALGGVASADQLIFEPGREIRATGTIRIAAYEVTCNVTLEGSLRVGSFERIEGTQAGEMSRATFSGCNHGSITALATPWRTIYSSITGGYPEAATALGLEAVSSQIEFSEPLIRGLYRGNMGLSFELTADGTLSEAWRFQRATLSSSLTLVSGTGFRSVTMTGSVSLAAAQQVRRRVARLDIFTVPMAPGVTTQTFTLENYSPAGEPDARITTLSLIAVLPGDAPSRFEIPAAENRCPGETLRAREVNSCRSNVRFIGVPAERRREATLRIDWNNGIGAVQNYAPVIAE